ncbi:MAG: hypothetical protein ACJAXJ_000301 [Colwellia sp.]|jgi:hypothetical protein
MNPANDRKTPYTDKKIELFVDGFIEGFGDEWEDLKLKLGEKMTRQRMKDRFIFRATLIKNHCFFVGLV